MTTEKFKMLVDKIINVLSNGAALTAREITKKLRQTEEVVKSEVNRVLYAGEGEEFKKIDGQPPRWMYMAEASESSCSCPSSEEEQEKTRPFTHSMKGDFNCILIDLGNCHGILERLDNYYLQKYNVLAFADRAYNISKHQSHTAFIKQATDAHKNAADCWLQYYFYKWCEEASRCLSFYVCTKDQGLYPMRQIAETYGHKVYFLTSWEELRNYIE